MPRELLAVARHPQRETLEQLDHDGLPRARVLFHQPNLSRFTNARVCEDEHEHAAGPLARAEEHAAACGLAGAAFCKVIAVGSDDGPEWRRQPLVWRTMTPLTAGSISV